MICKIEYVIRFPFGGDFKNDPRIIILQNIYKEIKKYSCINNSEKNCDNCFCKDKCIYYFLSGNNFNEYPGLILQRNHVNKKNFNLNDTIDLTFHLIGCNCNYFEFITEYLKSNEYIDSIYYQKILKEKCFYENDNQIVDGIFTYNTPIINIDDCINSIKYYNDIYKCNFNLPVIEIIEDGLIFNDYKYYRFNNKYIKYKGNKFTVKINNYPKILCNCGTGKNAILGGGRII